MGDCRQPLRYVTQANAAWPPWVGAGSTGDGVRHRYVEESASSAWPQVPAIQTTSRRHRLIVPGLIGSTTTLADSNQCSTKEHDELYSIIPWSMRITSSTIHSFTYSLRDMATFPRPFPFNTPVTDFIITGPPTHSVWGRLTLAGVCSRLSSSVGVCNTPRRNVTHQGAAHSGPVVLRPVTATPCLVWLCDYNLMKIVLTQRKTSKWQTDRQTDSSSA